MSVTMVNLLLAVLLVVLLNLISVEAGPGGRWKGPGGRWKGPGGRWKGPGGRWKGPGGRWKGGDDTCPNGYLAVPACVNAAYVGISGGSDYDYDGGLGGDYDYGGGGLLGRAGVEGDGDGPLKAKVSLNMGNELSYVRGELILSQESPTSPVLIEGDITHLVGGLHGFHVHQSGDFSNECASTGGHFNPHGKTHGGPEDSERHLGDLGNVFADDSGRAKVSITDSQITLSGPNSIIGRAFVVHGKADDLGTGGNAGSLATGNAGIRLACGLVEAL